MSNVAYMKRQAEYRAAQFTGSDSLKEVLKVLPLRMRDGEYTLHGPMHGKPVLAIKYSVLDTGFRHVLNFGDWLVLDPDALVTAMTNEVFESTFVKVPNPAFDNEVKFSNRMP